MKRESCNNWRAVRLAVTVGLTIALQSSAATHYVSQTSPNPTPPYSTLATAAHTIQEAVDVASDGDTVSVQPGDYGLTNQVTVTKGIQLLGKWSKSNVPECTGQYMVPSDVQFIGCGRRI